MPILCVGMFEGRGAEQKKTIARELGDGFFRGAGSGKPTSDHVAFSGVGKHDWATGYDKLNETYLD